MIQSSLVWWVWSSSIRNRNLRFSELQKTLSDTMESTNLSIFCADHHRFQAEIFKNFLFTNNLVDCTIAAEGDYLKAHKLILSACSSYFQILFTQEQERNPIVILKDIKYKELKSIIEFVYCGEVKIPADRLAAFLDAAQCLQIKGLEGVARSNVSDVEGYKNPSSEVDATSQAYSRVEISTTSDKNFQSNNSNGSEECASQFEQTICASNSRNNSDNPTHVQLDVTCSPAVLSRKTCPMRERAYVLSSPRVATNISTLPAPATNISQPNFHSSEYIPLIRDPLIEMEPSEAMYVEPKPEVVRDASVGKMSVTNDTNEMEEVFVPYEDIQYDTCIETEHIEAVLPEPKSEHDALLRNMSVTNEMEEDKSPVPHEENQYPAQSSHSSPAKEIAPALGAQRAATHISTPPAQVMDISQPNFQSSEVLPSIVDPLIKTEITEPMFLEARAEDIHDAPEGNMCITNDGDETEEENSVSYEENQYPDTWTASSPRREERAAPLDASPGPDNSKDVTEQISTRTQPRRQRTSQRERKRSQDDDAETTGANDMSYRFRGREEMTHGRPADRQVFCTANPFGGNDRPQHSADLQYQCDLCGVAFQCPSALKRHIRKHTGERPYRCDVCSATLSKKGTLNAHMSTHTGERPHRCDVCSATFAQKGKLKIHMRKHTGERPYRCDVCSAAFFENNTLKIHMRIHTGERPYRCDVCSAAFALKKTLNIHMRTHTGERRYRCDVCSAAFAGKSTLNNHMRRHTGERPYQCEMCSASFPQKGGLDIHMRRHTGERPYRCDVCSATFAQKGKLKIHMRIHTGERPYRCDVCCAAFALKKTLDIHMRTHTGERPYRCDVCSAAFAGKSTLNNHMRRHTGERPHRCDVCSATFAQKEKLKIHMRIHTGERPYRCDVCSAAFALKKTLNIHMRTHTGERSYRCDVCSAAFRWKVGLSKHMRTHTQGRVAESS